MLIDEDSNSLQIGDNGVISFRRGFTYYTPRLFPTSRQVIRNSLVVAPFWSDVDVRLEGSIQYETFVRIPGFSRENVLLNYVSGYVANEWNNAENFTGSTMLVVQWNYVPPYPHGSPRLSDDPDLIAFTNKVSINNNICDV